MKARTLISICLLSGLTAVAQTAPPSQKVAPNATKPAGQQPAAKPAVTPAKPATPPAATNQAAKPATTSAATNKAAKAAPKVKAVAKKPVTNAVAKTPAAPAKTTAGKRDPFVSPVREGGPGGPDCAIGKKCLAIDTIVLRGIVRAPSGAIAVVESSTRKVTYFLRENDPVFNGYVVKITADTVMFRENVVDRFGKQSTRDIPKHVNAPPV